MNIARIVGLSLLAGCVASALPSAADAQLGGALKRKLQERVAETVVGTALGGSAPNGSESGATRSTAVLEITPEVLDRLEKALAAEAVARESVARERGARLTREQYWECRDSLQHTDEGEEIRDRYMSEVAGASSDTQAMAAAERMEQAMERLATARCGGNPTTDKPEELQALNARIEAAGAQAGGFNLDGDAASTGRQGGTGGITTSREYSILKERIAPFCRAPERTGRYVYSASEQAALRPRCEPLMAALNQTL
jgi:hypothetical protein